MTVRAQNPLAEALALNPEDRERLAESLWLSLDGAHCVRATFAPYAAWAERQPAMQRASPRWGALPGDVAAVLEREGLRVGVVGLNSAFLQLTRADYERKLDLDVRQLHTACGGDAPAWLARNELNLLSWRAKA